MKDYQKPRAVRREARNIGGRFRGGKLAPVMSVPFLGGESGSVQQVITMELDPVGGRLITEVMAEVVSVFVPVQAIDALKNPADAFPGNAENVRQKLMSGAPLFGLEDETEISQRLAIVPRSIGGVRKVNEIGRLAHNAAVNFLRQSKYVSAEILDATSSVVTPALISSNVLDRLNAVLDPEDRVNGKVSLGGTIPVKGIGVSGAPVGNSIVAKESNEGTASFTYADYFTEDQSGHKIAVQENPDRPGFPYVRVELADAADISLQDFYEAETMDRIVRQMREIVDANPQFGEDLVARFALGLNIEPGRTPFVAFRKSVTFGAAVERAVDGPSLGTIRSNLVTQVGFQVPIPASEFGGVLITFVSVKPDETISSQPHPFLSDNWGAVNYAADELRLDPVPITIRDLNADCLAVDEDTVVAYIGNRHLEANYINYGFARNLDPTTVENKTALWQLDIPMSVTPSSIIYPENLDHYPFIDNTAEICTYTCASRCEINTPLIFGPVPVEELSIIETANVFQDV
jgi:hypothetical protein